MKKDEFICLMNADLMREFQHMHTYLNYAVIVRGLHRQELSEMFIEEAQSELKHCEEFSRMIVGLGGNPITPWTFNSSGVKKPYDKNPYALLEAVLEMEEEVVGIFAERMKQAEELGGPDGAVLHVFYENQILDSRLTVNNVREMIR